MNSNISITYKGVRLEVGYDYQPYERRTHDYPGCCEEAEIESIRIGYEEIIELLSEKQLEEIEIIVLKEREELIKSMKYGV